MSKLTAAEVVDIAEAQIIRLQDRIKELEGLLDLKLPCDVKLPPATVITKGCTLHTLAVGLKQRITENG